MSKMGNRGDCLQMFTIKSKRIQWNGVLDFTKANKLRFTRVECEIETRGKNIIIFRTETQPDRLHNGRRLRNRPSMETLGGWCDEAIRTIRRIGRQQGQRLGIPPAESTRHLFQRLAISLWRGNATLWINRQPIRPASVDGLV